jgi:hypothetical protein
VRHGPVCQVHRADGFEFVLRRHVIECWQPVNSSRSRRAILLAVAIMAAAGTGLPAPTIADATAPDTHVDQLAEAADTPTLDWVECADGFDCATA